MQRTKSRSTLYPCVLQKDWKYLYLKKDNSNVVITMKNVSAAAVPKPCHSSTTQYNLYSVTALPVAKKQAYAQPLL